MDIRDLIASKESFFEAIGEALATRGKAAGDYDQDSVYGVPRYVARMCESIVGLIGRSDLTVKDVLHVERLAAGHSDYQSKFALYCAQLARY